MRADFKLVQDASGEFGNEQLPNSGVPELSHLMERAVPTVEVADYADARGVRRPDGECDAFGPADLRDVRAELFVDLFVASFAKKMQIEFAKLDGTL